jgi:flagellar biogenesis protein FliO
MEAVLSAERRGWSGTLGWMAGPAAWLRSLGRTRGVPAPLRVEARLSLGAKKSLVLVNCRGRQVLLALSGDTVAPVLELSVPASPRARRKGGR